MRPLGTIRDGWEAVEKEELRLLRTMTVQESVREYLALRAEFEPWLDEIEERECVERLTRLVALHARLQAADRPEGERMEGLIDSLIAMQQRLERAGIPSVAIGGIAVGVWGRARLTRDIDLKVLLDRESREALLKVLLPDCRPLHADPDAALRLNGILFVHDPANNRIDFALADTEFDEAMIRRGALVEIGAGKSARLCTPEDLIVLKLVSTRERDAIDAGSIVARQGDALDDDYVLDWLRQFELALDDSTLVATFERLRKERTS